MMHCWQHALSLRQQLPLRAPTPPQLRSSSNSTRPPSSSVRRCCRRRTAAAAAPAAARVAASSDAHQPQQQLQVQQQHLQHRFAAAAPPQPPWGGVLGALALAAVALCAAAASLFVIYIRPLMKVSGLTGYNSAVCARASACMLAGAAKGAGCWPAAALPQRAPPNAHAWLLSTLSLGALVRLHEPVRLPAGHGCDTC